MIDLSFLQAFSIHRYVVEHFFFYKSVCYVYRSMSFIELLKFRK